MLQNKPMSTPGVAKDALSEAMVRSVDAASWQPAAVAIPCMAAMVGWGMVRRSAMTSEQIWNICCAFCVSVVVVDEFAR